MHRSFKYVLTNERTKERVAVELNLTETGEPIELYIRTLIQTGARLYAQGWDVHEMRLRRKEPRKR